MPQLVIVPADTEMLVFTDAELLYIRTLLGSMCSKTALESFIDNRGPEDGKRLFYKICDMLGTSDPNMSVFRGLYHYTDEIFNSLTGERKEV